VGSTTRDYARRRSGGGMWLWLLRPIPFLSLLLPLLPLPLPLPLQILLSLPLPSPCSMWSSLQSLCSLPLPTRPLLCPCGLHAGAHPISRTGRRCQELIRSFLSCVSAHPS